MTLLASEVTEATALTDPVNVVDELTGGEDARTVGDADTTIETEVTVAETEADTEADTLVAEGAKAVNVL